MLPGDGNLTITFQIVDKVGKKEGRIQKKICRQGEAGECMAQKYKKKLNLALKKSYKKLQLWGETNPRIPNADEPIRDTRCG